MAKRKEYSQEFKEKAIKLAKSADLSISQVALKLGVSNSALGRWTRDNPDGGAGALPEQDKSSDEEVIERHRDHHVSDIVFNRPNEKHDSFFEQA